MSDELILKNLIGPRVKVARLAVRGIELEKTAISKIESQRRPFSNIELVSLAGTFGVNILWLLGKD